MSQRLIERDLEEELRLEGLRDQQSKRRAREQSHALSLVERAAILLAGMALVASALIQQHHPVLTVGQALGGGFALIYQHRRRGDPTSASVEDN